MVTLENAPARTAVSIVRIIQAPIAQVYSAFTERNPISKWLSDDADVRAAVGGHILLIWQGGNHMSGVYTTAEKNSHVAFTWRTSTDSQDAAVDVQLSEVDNGTRLELTVSDFAGEAGTIEAEWHKRLDTLQAALENGEDIRITHRVIIGIFPADFNADIAERMGLPIKQGARVGNLVPGYSAADAGLQNDDVIVSVNGQDITDEAPIGIQVQHNKPGDVVNVVYYRGTEKHTVPVTLKGYPIPDSVNNFAELGDRLEGIYREQDEALATLFGSYSEAAGAHKSAPAEWSANEVLAHLILSERWEQNSLGCLLNNPEAEGWSSNHIARTTAVITVYPTSADLLAELKRSHAETVALLRNIPDKDGEIKTSLWQMNFLVASMLQHAGQHLDQIAAALKASES